MKKKEINLKFRKKNYFFLAVISLIAGFLFHLGVTQVFPRTQIQKPVDFGLSKEKHTPTIYKSAQKILFLCGISPDGEQCLADEFGKLTENSTLKHSLDTLSAVQTVNESARGCHLISHAISIAETKKDPTKWQDIIGIVPSDSCTGGFIHGVVEAYMTYDSKFEISSVTIPEICEIVDRKTEYRGKDLDCSHIMGHLVMVETGGFVAPANKVCDGVPEKLQYECYSGVFMENETRENLVSHKIKDRLFWDAKSTKDQEDICREYNGIAGMACWREISHMYAFISDDDPIALYDYCSLAPLESYRDDCYLHGIGVVGVSDRLNEAKFASFCTPFSDDPALFSQCMSVTVGSMLTSTPEYTPRSIKFCNAMGQNKRECYGYIGSQLQYMVARSSDRVRYCATAQKEYKSLCLAQDLTLNK